MNSFNEAAAAIDGLAEYCYLLNDPNYVTDLVKAAKDPLISLVEATVIVDVKEEEQETELSFCPDCGEEGEEVPQFEILPTIIEVQPEESRMRAVMYAEDGALHMLADWIEFKPEEDASLAVAQALESMAEAIRRRFNLSQIPPENNK